MSTTLRIHAALTRVFGQPEEVNGAERCPTYLYRWIVLSTRWAKAYVHRFVADDWSRDLHDHPKRFVSIGLWGRYTEWTPGPGHAFVPRVVYPNGEPPPVVLEQECGVVVHENGPLYDHDVCGRPEIQHLRQREYRAPWLRTFPATHIHRLTLPRACAGCGAPEARPEAHTSGCYIPLFLTRECWTLVIVFRPVRDWGFWHGGSFIPWRRYVHGTGSANADSRKACP